MRPFSRRCPHFFPVILAGCVLLIGGAAFTARLEAAEPPTIVSVSPAPGVVTTLGQVSVTFSVPVRGVRAGDFLVNGASATAVTGQGSGYVFSFDPPPYGTVEIAWSTFHTIEDLEDPPQRFEIGAPGSTWAYEYLDPDGPAVASHQPPAGSLVGSLRQLEVTFNKAVLGVDAADLQVNGVSATNLSGFGAGPYLFTFPFNPTGRVTVGWVASHGISSDAVEPQPLISGNWEYTVDPAWRPAGLVITEFMAENLTSLRDEDDDPEDWIEIYNPTGAPVDLEGWSLSNSKDDPGRWVFPRVVLAPQKYVVAFASGKDRRPVDGKPLHTNFKLNPTGDSIALHAPQLPRQAVSTIEFEQQGANFSMGREENTGAWRFYAGGTPGLANPRSTIREAVADVRFSVPRGFFNQPFNLALTCPTPGSFIRFTTNGSPPSETVGFLYTNSLRLTASRVIRAAAFKSNALPSRVATHTYLFNLSQTRLRLPALSLVTATNNLYGRTGIMEVSPRNTTRHGPAWERPVSVELIHVEDNGGFQVDCGLRIQGGDYVRGQYNYRSSELPFSKYSYRLYFRGEYGQGRLEYPLFPATTQQSFDTIVLRAGMNDHSNPFVLDEFVRTLALDCGQPAAVGTFVHLFLNGVYKGYYNPCERIDVDFLRAYHGGGEAWDIMAQSGEVREGDATAWNALRTLANTRNLAEPEHYRNLAGRMDLTNFVDYLCPLIYVDNDDWPHNNWRAARERVPGGLYRFYAWDAEWSFGNINGHSPSWNTIQNQLSTTSPPWGGIDIQRIFNGLKRSPEFRLLFADRVHKHFFQGGALTDERVRARYSEITNRLNGVVPGFNDRVGRTWIPQRRRFVLQHLDRAGFLASSNAPALNPHGGLVATGDLLVITNLSGSIYYTTNGTDPRVAFSGAVAPDALQYQDPIPLTASLTLVARSLVGTNWSARTEASFQVNQATTTLRFTEVMFNPPGGEAYEFIELHNHGVLPVDVSGFSFTGIEFRFPDPSPPMPPGAHWVLANDSRPEEFAARYPSVAVAGWYDASLNNGGERIELLDRDGRVVAAVEYDDTPPWPTPPDGDGPSLVLIDPEGDPSDPAAWAASAAAGGTPGTAETSRTLPLLRLSEVAAGAGGANDWIELHNAGAEPIDLGAWSLSDNDNPRRFVLAPGVVLPAGGWLRIWCSTNPVTGALHTGFRLASEGETVTLHDPQGRRMDAVTFGLIPDGYSLGRLQESEGWHLCTPTPEGPNIAAEVGLPSGIVINEWLPNPILGVDDWIEFHNLDPSLPAPLRGLLVTTQGGQARIGVHGFVPAGGFCVLLADGNPGPDHLGLRLPAAGGFIALGDDAGREWSRVSYALAVEGLTFGRIPNGTGEAIPLPGFATPGASNYTGTATGPRLNEWMALNEGSVLTDAASGRAADWFELHNPAATAFDLSGARIVIDDQASEAWTFPAGVEIAAGGYLVVWCDPTQPASAVASPTLNLGRGLPAEGASIALLNVAGQRIDTALYGPQLADRSVGRVGSGSGHALLASPTPGSTNAPAAELGSPRGVRLNEWLSDVEGDGGWLELFNPDQRPVDLGGHYLTDDPSIAGATKAPLPPLSLLAARGHAVWQTDAAPDRGVDHVTFSIAPEGETLRLYGPNLELIDSVDTSTVVWPVAAGRFPDGAERFVSFADSPSPNRANWLPHPAIVVHEVLTHTDPPLEDAVELHNQSARPVSLAGWWLSDDAARLDKHQLREDLVIRAGGYHVTYEYEFNAPNDPRAFALSSARPGEVWLTEVDAAGSPTGYRAHAAFGAMANGVSLGRHRTSVGWDVAPLSRRTFGKDLPGSLAEFRQGTGLPNAYPAIGPVLITEIHYRPVMGPADPAAADMVQHEFIEVHNASAAPVPLFDPAHPENTWRVRSGIDFAFPSGVTLPVGGFALLVPFSPTDAVAAADFRSRFNLSADVPLYGPFSGRLSNESDELRLERPDTPQGPGGADAGLVPYLQVERVHYRSSLPWPTEPLTQGWSLQRRRTAEYGNDPVNWVAAPPSPGRATPPPLFDRDFDGLANDWELVHGLNPDDPSDASTDSDLDGLSNLAEFLAGTNPREAESALRVSLAVQPSAGLVLRFEAAANRSYSVLYRDDGGLGAWERIAEVPADLWDREVSVHITPEVSGERGFFRIVTPGGF